MFDHDKPMHELRCGEIGCQRGVSTTKDGNRTATHGRWLQTVKIDARGRHGARQNTLFYPSRQELPAVSRRSHFVRLAVTGKLCPSGFAARISFGECCPRLASQGSEIPRQFASCLHPTVWAGKRLPERRSFDCVPRENLGLKSRCHRAIAKRTVCCTSTGCDRKKAGREAKQSHTWPAQGPRKWCSPEKVAAVT